MGKETTLGKLNLRGWDRERSSGNDDIPRPTGWKELGDSAPGEGNNVWHPVCDTHEETKEDQHGSSSRNKSMKGTKVGAMLRRFNLTRVQWNAFAEFKAGHHMIWFVLVKDYSGWRRDWNEAEWKSGNHWGLWSYLRYWFFTLCGGLNWRAGNRWFWGIFWRQIDRDW